MLGGVAFELDSAIPQYDRIRSAVASVFKKNTAPTNFGLAKRGLTDPSRPLSTDVHNFSIPETNSLRAVGLAGTPPLTAAKKPGFRSDRQ
jgi:hypothetical protein